LPAVPPDPALNTSVGSATTTGWQSYGGGTTLGYLAQIAVIAVQSFLSAVVIALIGGLARHGITTIGNFPIDLTRATLYVLLPVCVLASSPMSGRHRGVALE
jgi:K+-transporting ATPase ATPase A chain